LKVISFEPKIGGSRSFCKKSNAGNFPVFSKDLFDYADDDRF